MSRTTPREMADLLAGSPRGAWSAPAASAAMLQTLEHQLYADMLPRHLPLTYYPERLGLSEMPVRIAHKTGGLSGVRNDAGIVRAVTPAGPRTMIVSAFTADVADEELWTVENVGARAVADHRTPGLRYPAAAGGAGMTLRRRSPHLPRGGVAVPHDDGASRQPSAGDRGRSGCALLLIDDIALSPQETAWP